MSGGQRRHVWRRASRLAPIITSPPADRFCPTFVCLVCLCSKFNSPSRISHFRVPLSRSRSLGARRARKSVQKGVKAIVRTQFAEKRGPFLDGIPICADARSRHPGAAGEARRVRPRQCSIGASYLGFGAAGPSCKRELGVARIPAGSVGMVSKSGSRRSGPSAREILESSPRIRSNRSPQERLGGWLSSSQDVWSWN
jgi:hypothetical protein